MRVAVVVILALASSGCSMVSTEFRQLPAYAAAMALPARTAEPKFFWSHSVDHSDLGMVPYAEVIASGSDELARFRKIKKKALLESADVVLFEKRESIYAGSVGVYWGFGISSGQPVYRGVSAAVLYRFPQAVAGIATDANRMVLSLSEEARRSGIQEGDSLLSAGQVAWSEGSLWKIGLERIPGEQVGLVWVRPGAGRMEGRLELAAPDVSVPDSDSGIVQEFRKESQARRFRGSF